MEQETTQQCALPFPSKYGRIDKRYRFSDRASLTSLFMDYPLYDNRYPRQFPYGRRLNVPTEQSALAAHEVNRYYGYKALPEVVLLCIFKYMHPVDLVNGVSRVSKHWNALAKTPALYQEVRVLINRESAECGSAKEFLQRSRNHIEKLCLVYESNVFVDVLPDCMPNVKALDIGFFREMAKNVDKLTSCFPSVEMLYMDNVGKINSDVADKLFSETSFKRLRRLCLNVDGGIVDDMMQKLYAWNRPLELLNTCGVANTSLLRNSPITSTLTQLYLNGFMQTAELSIIGQFRNLTTFSLISALYMESEELLQLKSLYNLEHLHLDCCGEDCDASPEAIAEFFRLPSESASNFFPYRLKYLRMSDCHPFYFEAAQELVKSCPQLESLNVAWNQFMGEEALSLFIKNLSNLRFLNIGGLGEMKCEALCEISDDELPNLRFLSLHNTKVSEEILQRINLRRPNLFITNRSDYFINWGMRNGELHFNKEFRGDINAVLNDLAEIDGFCCMHSVI